MTSFAEVGIVSQAVVRLMKKLYTLLILRQGMQNIVAAATNWIVVLARTFSRLKFEQPFSLEFIS